MRTFATVTAFYLGRGFGYALIDSTQRSTVFIHVNDVRGKLMLREGDRIELDVIPTSKGPKGLDILLLEDSAAPATGGQS